MDQPDAERKDKEEKETTQFRKVLYLKQPFPDNYTDSSFLERLEKNRYVREYHYFDVVLATGCVTQQLSCVCLFPAVIMGNSSSYLPIAVSTAICVVGPLLQIFLGGFPNRQFLSIFLFLIFAFLTAPVLQSLTNSIATDTIWFMVIVSFAGHLLFYGYSTDSADSDVRQRHTVEPFSFNCALFAVICLSSRVQSVLNAYLTVTFGVVLFGVWSIIRKEVQRNNRPLNLSKNLTISPELCYFSVTLLHMVVTSLVLWWTCDSWRAVGAFLAVWLFLTFVCPAVLMLLQRHKDNIHGPWDEAVIDDENIQEI